MDFKDWRKSPTPTEESQKPEGGKYAGKKYFDYIEELISEAQARGEFDNLQGTGKPLHLDDDSYAGDKALGYRLLKNNGYAPAEIELAKEIRAESSRMEAKLGRVRQLGQALRRRRVPALPSEKRAYNATVEKTAAEYERKLRELNRKILTLNLTTPPPMHRPLFDVEKLVRQFRESCPLFA